MKRTFIVKNTNHDSRRGDAKSQGWEGRRAGRIQEANRKIRTGKFPDKLRSEMLPSETIMEVVETIKATGWMR